MNLYLYDGPVKNMGQIIAENWRAETRAMSEKKALSNFKYQYKKSHNMSSGTKIDMPGNIVSIKED